MIRAGLANLLDVDTHLDKVCQLANLDNQQYLLVLYELVCNHKCRYEIERNSVSLIKLVVANELLPHETPFYAEIKSAMIKDIERRLRIVEGVR
jgi:hypothetical protein